MRNEHEKKEHPDREVIQVENIGKCINSVAVNGYTELFTVTQRGLYALRKGKYYRPEQIKIQRIFKHSSTQKNDQNVLAYVLESSDGVRGTLIDYFDKKPDALTANFIYQTEELQRKLDRYNRHFKA